MTRSQQGTVCFDRLFLTILWTLSGTTVVASEPLQLPPVTAAKEFLVVDEVQPEEVSTENIFAAETFTAPAAEAEEDWYSVIAFPEEDIPLCWQCFEAVPTLLTWPDEPLGHLFETLLSTEHDKLKTDLDEKPIGLQPTPDRPPLILELNESFLAPGFLNDGLELPTGAVWRPSLWVFGQFRSAIQYFENHGAGRPVVESAHRLDLFGQVNFSGTERLLIGLRPLDEEEAARREFVSHDFNNGTTIDGWNADFQTLFFEGDFGEIFPWLDPYDSRLLDLGFSIGRMPLLAQQGLLINEDLIDAVTITRNTLNGHGNLNLRTTGVYAWDNINRNSPTTQPNTVDPGSQMVAILTESDFYHNTVNLDVAYAYGDPAFGDVLAFGASAIRRIHGYHNTYNTSLHVLASFPTRATTPFADQGELLFAQTSWTPHHTEDLIYLNAFLAIDQFTSPTRGPLMGGPLGQTGIVFAAPGVGRAGAPVPVRTNNTAGASLGYQLFFEHTRRQLILEVGGQKETKGPQNLGAIATVLRYQQACGQHLIWIWDGFVGKREGVNVSQGTRAEILIKF
ncbi:MAG: hypothetical protein MI725_11140 [Pirellulales bacterium]|nr:hypothetical protein [Pirellulales bacterium]